MGPEVGNGGGQIVVAGTPEQVVKNRKSYTGQLWPRCFHEYFYRIEPAEFGALRTVPLAARGAKCAWADFAAPTGGVGGGGTASVASSYLAAESLRGVVQAMLAAKAATQADRLGHRRARRQVRTGAGSDRPDGPRIPDCLDDERRAAITISRSRWPAIPVRRRGGAARRPLRSAEETAREMGAAIASAEESIGMGEALGRRLGAIANAETGASSLLLGAWRRRGSRHRARSVGTDTPHTHPALDPAALAAPRTMISACSRLGPGNGRGGGVYLKWDRPYCCRKSSESSLGCPQSGPPGRDFTTANFDFLSTTGRCVNVVERPHAAPAGEATPSRVIMKS